MAWFFLTQKGAGVPVFIGSRYQSSEYTTITGRDLISRKYVHPPTPFSKEDVDTSWIVHTVQVGEDLDLLAYRYTGDNASKSKFWWLICDVNGIMWPLDITPGMDLIIPIKLLATYGIS